MFDEPYEEEQELAQIRGATTKKKDMTLLNQKNVSKWDLDELFSDDDEYFEEI